MSEREDLISVLNDLKVQIKKQTSLRFAFARGLVYGLGTVIGATVLIGILSWLITYIFDDPKDIPIANEVLES